MSQSFEHTDVRTYNAIAAKAETYPFSSFNYFGKYLLEVVKRIATQKGKSKVVLLEVGANDGQGYEEFSAILEKYRGLDVSAKAVENGNKRFAANGVDAPKAELVVEDVLAPSDETSRFATEADVLMAIYVAPSIGFENLVKALDALMHEGMVLILIDRIYTADKAKGLEFSGLLSFFVQYWKLIAKQGVSIPWKRILRPTIYESKEYQAELRRHQENASGTEQEVLQILSDTFGPNITIEHVGDNFIAVIQK
jgi:hypothetical protein